MKIDSFCVIVKINNEVKEWIYPASIDSAYETFGKMLDKYLGGCYKFIGVRGLTSKDIRNMVNWWGLEAARRGVEHRMNYVKNMNTEIYIVHSNVS